MTDEAVSPSRRRMIEDMTIRKFAPKTQHDYVQRVKNFAAFLGRSPDTASFEDVRRYQLHLSESGVGVPTINQTVPTLRFFLRSRSGATRSSSIRMSFTSRASCRWCSAWRRWRGCSRAASGAADDHASAQSRLPCRGPDGGDQQARLAVHDVVGRQSPHDAMRLASSDEQPMSGPTLLSFKVRKRGARPNSPVEVAARADGGGRSEQSTPRTSSLLLRPV
jgi:hypothetical protein